MKERNTFDIILKLGSFELIIISVLWYIFNNYSIYDTKHFIRSSFILKSYKRFTARK